MDQKRDAAHYEARASRWLADANEHREHGRTKAAEACDEKAQRALDKANELRGIA